MEMGIQHIIDKLELASLALGERANVKSVGLVLNKQTNQRSSQIRKRINSVRIAVVVIFLMNAPKY